jgi:hypothetical protein
MGQHSSAAGWPLCRTELGTARLHGSHHRFCLARIAVECLVEECCGCRINCLASMDAVHERALFIGQLVVVCLPHQPMTCAKSLSCVRPISVGPLPQRLLFLTSQAGPFFWWRASTRMVKMDRMKRAGLRVGSNRSPKPPRPRERARPRVQDCTMRRRAEKPPSYHPSAWNHP